MLKSWSDHGLPGSGEDAKKSEEGAAAAPDPDSFFMDLVAEERQSDGAAVSSEPSVPPAVPDCEALPSSSVMSPPVSSDALPLSDEEVAVLELDLEEGSSLPSPVPTSSSASSDGAGVAVEDAVFKMMEGDEGAAGEAQRMRIGDRLVAQGVITQDQLNVALQEKKISGKMLGAVFVELGFVAQEDLTAFLAEEAGLGVFNPSEAGYDPECVALFDKRTARKLKALPVSVQDGRYCIAMSDPQDVVALDTLRSYLPRGAELVPLLASFDELSQGIDKAYGYASLIHDILKELEEGEAPPDLADLDEKDAFSHPIVRLVNALVFEAVKLGVSDLHFEPEENFVRLRYRLDGVLFTAQTLHKQHWSGIAQRLKIMSQMDIADKISPQDGRFNMEVSGREADFRVSSLPTVHGENIVLRVLDKSESLMPIEALGFSEENRKKVKRVQAKPEGIVIVTGPTGSGKTTSLYSMLHEINDVEVNIQTLEDPVEYSLPMIRQTHVREGVLEFADGIKALLRQDPDIIFIGEIRDKTTAEMALKAAMTGHQVYTSLHTNDSFGAIPRLLDLGLKPGMLSGAIVAVFAQRLARRLCEHCKTSFEPNAEERALLRLAPMDTCPTMYRANEKGCSRCTKGYKGRIALIEILMLDHDMHDLIAQEAPVSQLRKCALEKGFLSMAEDGVLKIKQGITDIAAVSKVVDLTSDM